MSKKNSEIFWPNINLLLLPLHLLNEKIDPSSSSFLSPLPSDVMCTSIWEWRAIWERNWCYENEVRRSPWDFQTQWDWTSIHSDMDGNDWLEDVLLFTWWNKWCLYVAGSTYILCYSCCYCCINIFIYLKY